MTFVLKSPVTPSTAEALVAEHDPTGPQPDPSTPPAPLPGSPPEPVTPIFPDPNPGPAIPPTLA